jgi:hypothetical protein
VNAKVRPAPEQLAKVKDFSCLSSTAVQQLTVSGYSIIVHVQEKLSAVAVGRFFWDSHTGHPRSAGQSAKAFHFS